MRILKTLLTNLHSRIRICEHSLWESRFLWDWTLDYVFSYSVIPFLPERKLPSFLPKLPGSRWLAGAWRCAGGVAKRPTLPIWHTHVLLQRRRKGRKEGGREGRKAACSDTAIFPFPLLEKNYVPFSLFLSLSPFFPLKMFEISLPLLNSLARSPFLLSRRA